MMRLMCLLVFSLFSVTDCPAAEDLAEPDLETWFEEGRIVRPDPLGALMREDTHHHEGMLDVDEIPEIMRQNPDVIRIRIVGGRLSSEDRINLVRRLSNLFERYINLVIVVDAIQLARGPISSLIHVPGELSDIKIALFKPSLLPSGIPNTCKPWPCNLHRWDGPPPGSAALPMGLVY